MGRSSKRGFSAGGSAGGSASNEVLAAKQRFAARAAQWKLVRNWILWAMRGAPNLDMGSVEGKLQNVLGDRMQVTSVNAPVLRALGKCGSRSTPIAGRFEFVRNCMAHTFQDDIQSNSGQAAACLRDFSPSCLNPRKPPLPICVHVMQSCDIYGEIYMQAALEDIIHRDLQVHASDMQKWVVQSFDEVPPPTPVAHFLAPVIPELRNVRSLVRKGAQLLKTSLLGVAAVMLVAIAVNTAGVAPNGEQPSTVSSGKGSRLLGVCWKVLGNKCQYTAEECAFIHSRVDRGSGSITGSVDSADHGGNSGGGSNGSGGSSSAIVVCRGGSSSANE